MTRDLVNLDISNMLEIEFKMTVIKMLAGLEKSIEDIRESLLGEIKSLSGEIK